VARDGRDGAGVTTGTVLVLPEVAGRSTERVELLDRQAGALDIQPVQGPASALAARVCGAIHEADPLVPLHVVVFGASVGLLPAVALAQRAARRRVVEYVIVGPDIPTVTETWPDAPVSVYVAAVSPAATHARLRGWSVHPVAEFAAWLPAG
jgi:hypothetical protein